MASPAKIVAATASRRASRVAELADALKSSTRRMTMKGQVWDEMDPHAAAVLQDANSRDVLAGLSDHLVKSGVKEVRPLSGGFESVVLDGGDRVVKIGRGRPRDNELPRGVTGVLPYESTAAVGPFRIELQRKARSAGPDGRSVATNDDVEHLEALLESQGWDWGDAARDNMGFFDGQPVAIDGNVSAAKGSVEWPVRRKPFWPDSFYPSISTPALPHEVDEAVHMRALMDSLVTRPKGYSGVLDGLRTH